MTDNRIINTGGNYNESIAGPYIEGDYINVSYSLPQHTFLHQLPLDIADFTGRYKEVEVMTALLRQAVPNRETAVVVSAVAGMAGVGKSALAIHVAHRLKSDFPDAQLYVNLRGGEGQPLEPSDVLAGFLQAWGVDSRSIPENLTDRASLYRSLLADKKVLVLLDNARDETQVRPLLPGSSTCAVLVTSRQALAALEGAEIVELGVMSKQDALTLLQVLVGSTRIQAEMEASRQIVSLCGCLPLALRISGGTLKNKPHWAVAEYTQKLAVEQQRLSRLHLGDLDLRSSFDLSYRELAPMEAQLFRLLGLIVGASFTLGVASILIYSTTESLRKF